ncbi:MAG: GNAT family N-acetyltransferase, partial [Parvibaculaceae bacterium]
EIGWGVSPDHWRRGYGTEIGRALLGLAFERVSAARVWAKIMSANGPSLKLAHRIGLKHDRSYADYPAGHGKFTAVDIYALRAGDYFDAPY